MGLLALSLVMILGLPLGWTWFRGRTDRAALVQLQSRDPAVRRRGAQLAAGVETPGAWRYMAALLSGGGVESGAAPSEPDPDVREACVYALGRSGVAGFFPVIAGVIQGDPHPYVRQTAWLAAARLDPERFRALAAALPPGDEPADRIGRAAAWVELGDPRGAPDLLRWAVEGDAQQRKLACLALYRGVAPLLEAVGRWPRSQRVTEEEPWSPELVAEVARRCAALDLAALADDTRPHVRRAALVRRNVSRLNAARARLTRLLWSQ